MNLKRLISWSQHAEPGVRYFSGAATYHKLLEVPASWLAAGRRIFLDLGRVEVIAKVTLNGRDLGVLWKPPFRVEVTGPLHAGVNALEIEVANLWANRLIGDEHLPPDCQWRPAGYVHGWPQPQPAGNIAEWPQWLLDGLPSPAGRHTFTTWRHLTKYFRLLDSGLLGPVRLEAAQLAPFILDAAGPATKDL